MKRYLLMLSLWLAGLGCINAGAVEHLVMIGGGEHPPQAVKRFADWARLTDNKDPRVLIVGWAGGKAPGEEPVAIEEELAQLGIKSLERTPHASEVGQHKDLVEKQIRRASGIFFLGGQQGRIMDVVGKNPWLLNELRDRYKAGVVFGGTSAGTAIMSRTMLTGDGDFTVIKPEAVVTVPGLGMLEDVVMDQHFLKRQRMNRLMSVLLKGNETLGLGIDESTALSVEGNRIAEVVGPGMVAAVDTREIHGKLTVTLLQPGQKFDLVTRNVIP